MKVGEYKGKIVDYCLIDPKQDGNLRAEVVFSTVDGKVKWSSGFKEGKNREIAIKTLITLGLTSVEQIGAMVDGAKANVLNTEKEFDITVHEREYNNKKWFEVKSIGRGVKTGEAATTNATKSFIAQIGGDFAAIAQELGVKKVIKNYAPGGEDILL